MARDLTSTWANDGNSLRRSTVCPTFKSAIDLVCAVAVVAEAMDHHPDIDIRWCTVTFVLSTHSAGTITQLDFQLASEIDALIAASN